MCRPRLTNCTLCGTFIVFRMAPLFVFSLLYSPRSLSLSLFLFPFFILLGSSPQKFSLKKREAKECCLYILPFNEQESRASVEQPLFHLVSVKTAEVFDKSGSQHHGASKTSSGGGDYLEYLLVESKEPHILFHVKTASVRRSCSGVSISPLKLPFRLTSFFFFLNQELGVRRRPLAARSINCPSQFSKHRGSSATEKKKKGSSSKFNSCVCLSQTPLRCRKKLAAVTSSALVFFFFFFFPKMLIGAHVKRPLLRSHRRPLILY